MFMNERPMKLKYKHAVNREGNTDREYTHIKSRTFKQTKVEKTGIFVNDYRAYLWRMIDNSLIRTWRYAQVSCSSVPHIVKWIFVAKISVFLIHARVFTKFMLWLVKLWLELVWFRFKPGWVATVILRRLLKGSTESAAVWIHVLLVFNTIKRKLI